jgi:hypothetical protein
VRQGGSHGRPAGGDYYYYYYYYYCYYYYYYYYYYYCYYYYFCFFSSSSSFSIFVLLVLLVLLLLVPFLLLVLLSLFFSFFSFLCWCVHPLPEWDCEATSQEEERHHCSCTGRCGVLEAKYGVISWGAREPFARRCRCRKATICSRTRVLVPCLLCWSIAFVVLVLDDDKDDDNADELLCCDCLGFLACRFSLVWSLSVRILTPCWCSVALVVNDGGGGRDDDNGTTTTNWRRHTDAAGGAVRFLRHVSLCVVVQV